MTIFRGFLAALTGEDMYLTRVLKKYSRRGSLSGYQRAGTSPDSMYYVEPDGLLFHVEELASAGVLPGVKSNWLPDAVVTVNCASWK